MPKNEEKTKVDVHNKGERTYTTPSGATLAAGQTIALEAEEAETLMASYPRDLISPDALRSAPASQSDKDRRAEIDRLQGIVTGLEGEKAELTKKVEAMEVAADQGRIQINQQQALIDAVDTAALAAAKAKLAASSKPPVTPVPHAGGAPGSGQGV